ncbi:hypothetical protein WA026_000726, partial [Henosepilachna vigintioctopunctata]
MHILKYCKSKRSLEDGQSMGIKWVMQIMVYRNLEKSLVLTSDRSYTESGCRQDSIGQLNGKMAHNSYACYAFPYHFSFVKIVKTAFKLFYTWGREAGDGSSFSDSVELFSQEFPLTESVGPPFLLSSLDRLDYVPPAAATPAPTDIGFPAGPAENAG